MCIYNTQKEGYLYTTFTLSLSQQKNILDVFPNFDALSQNKFLC